MGKKKNPSTAEDPGSSSVKASRRSQRFSLQPLTCSVTNGVAKHLDRRPWLRPEYIRRSYSPSVASEESLGKSARARRRSICQLKKRQPINQDSTRETLNPTPPTLPANQRRAQTSTTLSCSKTKTALRIPEEYSIGSSSATNSTTETGENIATTKKARAMRMKLRATKTSSIAKRLPRDAGVRPKKKVDKWELMSCLQCGALVWGSESVGRGTQMETKRFSICCQQGRVKLPPVLHRIGSLLPPEGKSVAFLQLFIFDTQNEVANRKKAFLGGSTAATIDDKTLSELIHMLDEHNPLAKTFRHARDRYEASKTEEFTITLKSQRHRGRQYDLPTSDEIAGLIVGDFSVDSLARDIVVEFKSLGLQRISDLNPLLMSLQYPILFPYGEPSYHERIPYQSVAGSRIKRECMTMREYYAYQIQTRLGEGMTLIKSRRLLHQYIVDAYTATEQERLRFISLNQKKLRADLYSNVCYAIDNGDTRGCKAIGWYGNPNLFITVTANPNWVEISDHLKAYDGESANSRPDLECRVFKLKLDEIMSDFKKGVFFPKPSAVVYTIEFQKCGLPYAHILLWFDTTRVEPTPAMIDQYISAELPKKLTDPVILDLDHEVSQNDRDFSLLAQLPHTARTGDCTDGLIDPFDQFMHFDQPNLTKARILHLSEDIGHTWSSMVHDLNMVVHTDSPTSVVLLTAKSLVTLEKIETEPEKEDPLPIFNDYAHEPKEGSGGEQNCGHKEGSSSIHKPDRTQDLRTNLFEEEGNDLPQSTDHYIEPAQHGVQDVLNISTEVHVFHRTRLDLDHARLEKDHARLDLDHEVSQNDRDFSFLARLPHTARTGDRTDGLIDPFDQFMHFDQPNLTKARILHQSEDIGHTWFSMVHDQNMVVHTDSPTSVVLLTAVHASGYNESGQKPNSHLVKSYLFIFILKTRSRSRSTFSFNS
uniref:Helitron helicase-like domain-containing protein n=1 Tax=Brassica oleracea var. oleracea TaxID=109376 RepID=A0A0D3DL02_BRAOL